MAVIATLTRLVATLLVIVVVIARTVATLLAGLVTTLTGLVATLLLIVVVIARTIATLLARLVTTLTGLVATLLARLITALLSTALQAGAEALGTETALALAVATVGAVCALRVDARTLWATATVIIFLIT